VCARAGPKRWKKAGWLRLDNGAAMTVTFGEFLYSTVTIDRIQGHEMDSVILLQPGFVLFQGPARSPLP
jgi:hypothetical protein